MKGQDVIVNPLDEGATKFIEVEIHISM